MKISILSLLLTGLNWFSPTFSYARDYEDVVASIFKNFPQREEISISNGSKFLLPVHYRQIEALVILGSVDLEAARKLLKGSGLHPAPITPKRSLAVTYMVNHVDNTIGPYKEFVTLIAATPDPKLSVSTYSNRQQMRKAFAQSLLYTSGDRQARDNKNFMYYVPWINVTTEDALLAGREIWNLPKEYADFDLQFEGSRKSASMKSRLCNIEFSSNQKRSVTIPLYMDFNLIGNWQPNTDHLVKAPMFAKGKMKVSLFSSSKGDLFKADPQTECGAWLADAQFNPLIVQYVPRSGALLFEARNLIIRNEMTVVPFLDENSIDRHELLELMDDEFLRDLPNAN